MKSKTPISVLKIKAKEQLLGNYSVAAGSVVILFIMIYSIVSIMSGSISAFAFGSRLGSQNINPEQLDVILSNRHNAIMLNILTYIVMFIAYPLIAMFSVGFLYICREVSYGRRAVSSGLFFVFKNHPDKIIVISAIMYGVQLVLMAPSIIYNTVVPETDMGGKEFLVYITLSMLGMAAFIMVSLALSQSYLIYLDDTEKGAIDCMRESHELMKGNKWRFFYLQLSFVGYAVLMIMSIGVAGLWIAPYMEVAAVDFYRDLKDDLNTEVKETGNIAGEDSFSGGRIDIEL